MRDAFPLPPAGSLSGVVEHVPSAQAAFGFAPERRASESQWHTPPRLARRLVSLLCLDGLPGVAAPTVLDLGAGGGALTDALLDAHPGVRVLAVERDPEWARFLREKYASRSRRVFVIEGDVDEIAGNGGAWDVTPSYVVSNPPFEGGGFARFAEAALTLARSGASCAFLIRLVDLATVQSLRVWRRAEISDVAICSRRPKFGGEKSDGAKEDFAVVRFGECADVGETHHGARVHVWPEAWNAEGGAR